MKNELCDVNISPKACKQQNSLPKIMVTCNESLDSFDKSFIPKQVKFSNEDTQKKQSETQSKKAGKRSSKTKSKSDISRCLHSLFPLQLIISYFFHSQDLKKTVSSKIESGKKSFKRALSLNNVSEKRKVKETEQSTKASVKAKPLIPNRSNLRRNSIPPEKGTKFDKKQTSSSNSTKSKLFKKDKEPLEKARFPKTSISEFVQKKGLLQVIKKTNLQRRKSQESLVENLRDHLLITIYI